MSSSIRPSKPERRRKVFLAARATFSGANAQIRDRNVIIRVVSKNERPFREIFHQFTRPIVFDIIQTLLLNRVFESEIEAKLAFPELYSISAVRGLQHAASEQDAARSEKEALEDVSKSKDDVYGQPDEDDYQRLALQGHSFVVHY